MPAGSFPRSRQHGGGRAPERLGVNGSGLAWHNNERLALCRLVFVFQYSGNETATVVALERQGGLPRQTRRATPDKEDYDKSQLFVITADFALSMGYPSSLFHRVNKPQNPMPQIAL